MDESLGRDAKNIRGRKREALCGKRALGLNAETWLMPLFQVRHVEDRMIACTGRKGIQAGQGTSVATTSFITMIRF
jgi:hypothetical protein